MSSHHLQKGCRDSRGERCYHHYEYTYCSTHRQYREPFLKDWLLNVLNQASRFLDTNNLVTPKNSLTIKTNEISVQFVRPIQLWRMRHLNIYLNNIFHESSTSRWGFNHSYSWAYQTSKYLGFGQIKRYARRRIFASFWNCHSEFWIVNFAWTLLNPRL